MPVVVSVSSVEIDDILVFPLGILHKQFSVLIAHPFETMQERHAGLVVGRHFVLVAVDHVPNAIDIFFLEVRNFADATMEIIFVDLTISISVANPPVPIEFALRVLKLLLGGSAFIMRDGGCIGRV